MNNNIRLNTNNTYHLHNILYSWLYDINPQFFLSIQLPKYLRSTDLLKSNKNLKKIMLKFEQLSLLLLQNTVNQKPCITTYIFIIVHLIF